VRSAVDFASYHVRLPIARRHRLHAAGVLLGLCRVCSIVQSEHAQACHNVGRIGIDESSAIHTAKVARFARCSQIGLV
jgi:hypothetical protein